MVILGGLELVAAGYLIHQHQKNKKDREQLEEESYPLQEDGSHRRSSHRRHSHDRRHSHERRHSRDRRHGRSHSYDGEGKRGRHRSQSRERRHGREKEEYVQRPGRGRENNAPLQASLAVPAQMQGRQNSAPPSQRPAPVQRPPAQKQTEPGYPPTGWPPHWAQSRTPPTPAQNPAGTPGGSALSQRPAPPAGGNNGYPADVKYGFDPSIPHHQYPQPPPPYQAIASTSQQNLAPPQANSGSRDGRRERRRAKSDSRRSISPNLGLYDERAERARPNPRVRFAVDDQALVDGGRDSVSSPPPRYRA